MKITPGLLKKYAEGKCNDAEVKAIEEWQNSTTDIGISKASKQPALRKERIWQGIEQATMTVDKKDNPRLKWTIAACLTAFLASVSFVLLYLTNPGSTTHSTGYAETQHITLKDGTQVTLNANSLLTIHDDYGDQERMVQFEGEAYFQVSKNPGKPFILETKDARIEVLGTAFNLKAIKDKPTTLTLQEGKVSFSTLTVEQAPIIVLPNEQVFFVNGAWEKRQVKPDKILLWTKGKLFFDNKPLSAICETLENLYGVEFEIGTDNLINKKFRGVVNNKDLTSILGELAFVMEFQFSAPENRAIRIY